MSNYNKVLLMGRLTRDPELRYTPQGTPVSEIGIAVNREFVVGTERRKETTFVDITLWRRQAEVVCQYLKKGAPIFVEGHLALDSWEAQDGQKRSKLRVIAENFQFLGGRQEGDSARPLPADEGVQGESGYSASSTRRPFPPSRGGSQGAASTSGSRFAQGPDSAVPAPEDAAEPAEAGPLGLEDSEIPF